MAIYSKNIILKVIEIAVLEEKNIQKCFWISIELHFSEDPHSFLSNATHLKSSLCNQRHISLPIDLSGSREKGKFSRIWQFEGFSWLSSLFKALQSFKRLMEASEDFGKVTDTFEGF